VSAPAKGAAVVSDDLAQFPDVFAELQEGPLSGRTVEASFRAMLAGNWNSVQIAALLAALRIRGETSEVITAATRAMRAAMVRVNTRAAVVLDTCGTGGDRSGSINLSTAAAILCAATGVTVAKHGNRAVSSQAGSADVLAALGIPTGLPADASERLLEQVNIAFLLAPVHHPAMRHVMPVRRELGVRTLFNCLGPLANPAGATHQLLGAFSDELRPILAQTLAELGTVRAWVVRSEDGMDEVSPYGPTRVTEVRKGQLREFVVAPSDFGLPVSPAGAAKGGDAAANADVIQRVFRNEDHPARTAIVLNAAAALVVARDIPARQAASEIATLIENGKANDQLARFREAAVALAKEA
jgi:anthranilate phosphoribosyltransferase